MDRRTRAVIVGLDPDLLDLAEVMPELEIAGFLDPIREARDGAFPNLGADADWPELLKSNPDLKAILSVDPPKLRDKLARHYGMGNLLRIIAPDAFVSRRAVIGEGSLLQRRTYVGRNSTIGAVCKLNVGATVHHDCSVGDYCTIAPGARLLGTVSIGRRSYIGSEAVVLPRRRIGDDVVIGAGAVVTRDVPSGTVVAGSPARVLDKSPKA